MRQALASLVLLVAAVLLSTCAFIERDVWIEHVVVLSERHFIRLVRSYTSYYHEERCRLGLHKDTPNERAATHLGHPQRRESLHCREWVDCTTGTNGARLPESSGLDERRR